MRYELRNGYFTDVKCDAFEGYLGAEGAFYVVDDYFKTDFPPSITGDCHSFSAGSEAGGEKLCNDKGFPPSITGDCHSFSAGSKAGGEKLRNDKGFPPPHSCLYWFRANEANKTLETVESILEQLMRVNLRRDGTIVAIGGGITLDVAAFVASIYKRGCRLVFIPTTLIGMIDASVGGKTGVNWGNLKNQVGTFYPANEVILDFNFLKTLPEKEMKSGYAELIKMMIIKERDFFNQSFAYIEENLQEYLLRAVKYKLEICSEDFTDMGRRQVLNLGHTYAHLLESVSDFRISHGDAVAEGLRNVLRVSLEKGILSEENYHKILMYIDYFCNKVELTEGQRERIEKAGGEILRADKKDGKIILASDEGVIDSYLFKIIKIVLDKKSHLK